MVKSYLIDSKSISSNPPIPGDSTESDFTFWRESIILLYMVFDITTTTTIINIGSKYTCSRFQRNKLPRYFLNVLISIRKLTSQQKRDIDPLLGQCWNSVCDAGPTLNQHRVNVSCLQGGFGFSLVTMHGFRDLLVLCQCFTLASLHAAWSMYSWPDARLSRQR